MKFFSFDFEIVSVEKAETCYFDSAIINWNGTGAGLYKIKKMLFETSVSLDPELYKVKINSITHLFGEAE